MFRAIHKYFVTYQLPVIFVGSHHIGSDTLATGFGSECTYHIIGFVACHFQNGDAVGAYNILYNRYGKTNCFWSFFALCFILFKSLAAEGRTCGVEGYSYMSGILFFQYFFEGVHKTQYG